MKNYDSMMALSMYMYNTSGHKYVQDVYGDDLHRDYIDEKATLWTRLKSLAISELDFNNRRKLFRIAWDRYGEAASQDRTENELHEKTMC